MTHTVIGIFDSKEETRNAMNELVEKGFIKENIDVSNRKKMNETVAATNADTTAGDSISNFFSNLFGGDETSVRNYSDIARDTEGIVTVQTDTKEKAAQAAKILDSNGAIDVDDRAAQYRQKYAQTSGKTGTAQTAQNRTANEGEMTIPVVEEELQVGKRAVETGGVRIKSRIVEKPVEETLRLREEHIVVDRRPANRAATEADFKNFKEGDIEITERAEKAVVNKEARVVGEVAVGKKVEEHEQKISDTVRKTEVDVEKLNTNVDTDVDTAARGANK
ncbi:MAG: YsnF/AvaK domain-containing protein [Acidobacteriota bacterium]